MSEVLSGEELQALIDTGIAGLVTYTDQVLAADIELFAAELKHAVTVRRLGGMSEQAIFNDLLADAQTAGPVFGKFENTIKRTMYGSIQRASNMGELLTYKAAGLDTKLLQWVAFSKKPCPDCDPRDGRIETPEFWATIGLPGTGWSLCGHSCNCRLMSASLGVPEGIGILTSKPVASS